MKITHIHVTAGRGFNHPYEQYANFKFDLHFQAELEEGEDHKLATQQLQAEAENAAEAHKAAILDDLKRKAMIESQIESLNQLKRLQKQNYDRTEEIEKAEKRLAELTSKPLLLSNTAVLHPGHPDHPDTMVGYDGDDD